MLSLDIAPTLAAIGPGTAAVRAFLVEQLVDGEAQYATDLVLEELLSNIVRHGGVGSSHVGDGAMSVAIGVEPDVVEIRVRDRGIAFDPTLPTTALPGHARADGRVGGFGLTLVRQFVQHLHYERAGGENRLCVRIGRSG
jgi:anti-sigma regulatory factor (Ser/Thr protein kinase)